MQRTETGLRGMQGKQMMGCPGGTTQRIQGMKMMGYPRETTQEDAKEGDDGVPRRNNTGHRKYPQSKAGLILGASSSKS